MAIGYGQPCPKPDRLAESTAKDRDLARKDAQWASYVKIRDFWTCQLCGRRVKKTLAFCPERAEADHVYCKSTYPELRHELDNGVTECLQCHRQAQKDRSLIPQALRDRAAACLARVHPERNG